MTQDEVTLKQLERRVIGRVRRALVKRPELDACPLTLPGSLEEEQYYLGRDAAEAVVDSLTLAEIQAILDADDSLWENEEEGESLLQKARLLLSHLLYEHSEAWLRQRNPPPGGIEVPHRCGIDRLLAGLRDQGVKPGQVTKFVIPQLFEEEIKQLAVEIMDRFPNAPGLASNQPVKAGEIPEMILISFLRHMLRKSRPRAKKTASHG